MNRSNGTHIYQRVWDCGEVDGDEAAVLQRVRGEPQHGGDEEDGVEGDVEQGEAGGPAECLAEVGGGGQVVERLLGDAQRRFQRRRVGREVEVGPRQSLDPHRRNKNSPPPPRIIIIPL